MESLIQFPKKNSNSLYGAYKLTLNSFDSKPKVELLYSSDDGEDCVTQAHFLAEQYYREHSDYSLNIGIIPLRAKWIVYNLMSYEVDIFYACRRERDNERARHQFA